MNNEKAATTTDSRNSFFRNHKWLTLLLALMLITAAAGLTDYCCETVGVSLPVQQKLVSFLKSKGILLKAESLHFGLFKGITLRNAVITDIKSGAVLEANILKADLFPRKILNGIFLPVELEVEGGSFSVPLFPEFGKEAEEDRLVLSSLNARIVGEKGLLQLRHAGGYINGVRFRMSGDINNVLHFSLAHSLDYVRDKMTGTNTNDITEDQNPILQIIYQIPLDIRRRILKGLSRFNEKKFAGTPYCKIHFFLDLNNFSKCSAISEFQIPEFKYGKLKIQSIVEQTELKNGSAFLKEATVHLENGGKINLSGEYNCKENLITGKLQGKCYPEDLMLFIEERTMSISEDKFSFEHQMVTFDGSLDSFNLATGATNGEINFNIPKMVIDKIEMQDVKIKAKIKGNQFTGQLVEAKLNNDGSLSGSFNIIGERLNCKLQGTIPPAVAQVILGKENTIYLNKYIIFNDKKSLIKLSGELYSEEWKKSEFTGIFHILLSDFQISGINIRNFSTNIQLTPESIQITDTNAVLPDGSKLKGNVFVLPNKSIFSASLICTGSPSKLINSLQNPYRDYLKDITSDIQWPADDKIIEGTVNIHADYGSKEPMMNLSGSLILKDFAYQNIPFTYGAARFVIMPDRTIILPDVILSTHEGQMALCAVYQPGKNKQIFPLSPGQLNFSLKSTINGNDLIRILYPQWSSQYIDFKDPIMIAAHGVLDYAQPEKTVFQSQLSNGSCSWSGISVNNIDAQIFFKNEKLTFKHAESIVAEGLGITNYEYDFRTEKGNFDFTLNNADVYSLMKDMKFNVGKPGDPAKISGQIKADIAFDENDDLLLYGDGEMQIVGENLWSMPGFGGLLKIIGKAWNIDSFGAITKINTKFALKDDKANFTEIKSNGSFVSVSAKGYYRWTPGDYDLTFQAELLKNALPFNTIPHLLYPFSWFLLRKNLKGTTKEYRWE